MVRKTQITTKFRANAEEEAENVVFQVEHETEGIISKKAIDLTKKRARKEMM